MSVHRLYPHLADGSAAAAHEQGERRPEEGRAECTPEPLIWVRRHLRDWPRATYLLSNISDLHGDQDADYRRGGSPDYLYGHVWCDAMEEGTRLHPCHGRSGAHLIEICVARSDNEQVFGQLIELCASPSPGSISTAPVRKLGAGAVAAPHLDIVERRSFEV